MQSTIARLGLAATLLAAAWAAQAAPAAPALLRPTEPALASRGADADRAAIAPTATQATQATRRVAEGPRTFFLRGSSGKKFSGAADSDGHQISVVNPYMDPPNFLFGSPAAMQCKADGGLVLASRAGLDADARATAIGYWNVAPDGAVTPLHTRSTAAKGKTSITVCDAPYGQAVRLEASGFAISADGGLVTAQHHGVIKIGADGYVRRLAGSPLLCEGMGSAGIRGFADGGADRARFNNDGHGGGAPATAVDNQGNTWTADQAGCALRRIAPDGSVATVLRPKQVCAGPPAKRITLAQLSWDAGRGELVSGGNLLVRNQLYTSVWRIHPDGTARRVLLAHKVGSKSPAGVQLDGLSALAVDGQGRIHIASRVMPSDHGSRAKGSDEIGVMRVDETRSTVVAVTGTALPAWGHGHKLALDGPAARATFKKMQAMCFAPDGTLFVLDELTVRRIDRQGQVGTWVF
ncbi:MAG: hypothetical protein LH480_01840 [Rubrivivax sp.]|nr:hypothetical protein [Rubrivivax sp.]